MSARAKLYTAILVVLATLGILGGVWLAFAPVANRKPEMVETVLEDAQSTSVKLRYNSAYARFPAGKTGGRMEALDLAAFFPGFGPAGDAETALPEGDGQNRSLASDRAIASEGKETNGAQDGAEKRTSAGLIFLHIAPPGRMPPPEERVIALYGHFLEPEAAQDESGLIARKFQPGTPYEGEDLYFAPPDGRSFAARCAPPSSVLPSSCLSTFRTGLVETDMRFDRSLLPQWEALIEGARALSESFLAP